MSILGALPNNSKDLYLCVHVLCRHNGKNTFKDCSEKQKWMPLRDYLRAANLVEGAVWKVVDIQALKPSNSCNQLITPGRCEARCRAEENAGSHEDCGRLWWWRLAVCAQGRREAACQWRVQKAALLAEAMGCKCSWLVLCMGLATPVTSFLLSRLLALLPGIPAAFLILPVTQVLLVRSPARPDCRGWLTWSLMLSRANGLFLLDHAYHSSWDLMGWKDSYACVMCYQNDNSKVSV